MIDLCPDCNHVEHAGVCGELVIRVMSKRCGIGTYCTCIQRPADAGLYQGGQHEKGKEQQAQEEAEEQEKAPLSEVTAAGAGVDRTPSAPGSSMPTEDPGIPR